MKHFSLLFVVFLVSMGVKAQDANSFSLNLYGGYTFSDKVSYYNSSGEVGDGFEYGAGFEYFITKNASVELKYLRQQVDLPIYILGNQINAGDDKSTFNFILGEGTYYFDTGSSNVSPYLGGGLGVAIVQIPRNGSDTNFAWDVKAGVKLRTSSLLSINLNAYLQSVSTAVGNSYYWTYYYGPVAVTDYVASYQFGLGAVFSFNFK
ncbi:MULTISPECIES: outer membrane beta-barrel protein [unclassified Flavobacterium]|jgi:opacity protein-like surface antigen|uniref:outer membrane beta-barrel protein n=1 Tax=unclassified Flavobacterium TaxID=196869 RepID=UPI00057CD131|nr:MULTISPECIES: outer membrane beta-barrel protein [unclassified Flavobacterium]KIA94447.1 hypothetical protein OA93_20140 [Flavobacterium sp. KMS]KIC00783.1 hypothetical protein OA88_17175 [Flavobacterium sp. JRM]MEA9415373.1 outer membrane beta-barrel protein [Flavobacterium sp. PL02]OUL62019.1 hypothetical protein B8T70_12270 [Flavobacterium sp. AJR]